MKVLVAGGLTPGFEKGNAEEVCARAIGRALASSGHVLLNGSYNDFDRIVAESALEAARANPDFGDPKMAIHTYLSPGVTPAHRLGLVRNLNVNSWDPGQPEWGIPEPLRECEALIVMGGGPATHRVVHLTRLVGKPILPNHSLRRSREGGVPNRMGKIRIVLRRASASVPRDHGFGFDDQQS